MDATPLPVEAIVELDHVLPGGSALPMMARLGYDPTDPYAVHVIFYDAGAEEEAVPWIFARELLLRGVDEPSGMGQVRVWPSGKYVMLALSSSAGQGLYAFPRPAVVRFCRRMTRSVDLGFESKRVEIDRFIEEVLPDCP